jgi:hypothetical protein
MDVHSEAKEYSLKLRLEEVSYAVTEKGKTLW